MKKLQRILLCLLLLATGLPVAAQSEFDERLSEMGIVKENLRDWSDSTKIEIPEPNCAYINVTGIEAMPTSKTADLQAWIEVYDANGNYFKKRAIVNAQGNSSYYWFKK